LKPIPLAEGPAVYPAAVVCHARSSPAEITSCEPGRAEVSIEQDISSSGIQTPS